MSRYLINNTIYESVTIPLDELPFVDVQILKSVKAKTIHRPITGMTMKVFMVEKEYVAILPNRKFISLKRDEFKIL